MRISDWSSDVCSSDLAPPPPDAPAAPDATQVMDFTDSDEDVSESSATAKDGKKRKVHRIVVRRDGAGDGKAPVALSGSAHGQDKTRIIEFRAPGELSRDDETGRAHVSTPVTNAHLERRLM